MKSRRKSAAVMRLLKIAHALITTAMVVACVYIWYMPLLQTQHAAAYTVAVAPIYLLLILRLGRVYGVYRIGGSRIRHLLYAQGLTVCISAAICYVVACVLLLQFVNPLPLLITLAAQILWCLLWCLLANWTYFRLNQPQKSLVIYKRPEDMRALENMGHLTRKFNIIEKIQATDDLEALQKAMEGYEIVFLTGLDGELRNCLMKYCINHNIQCYFPPRVGDVLVSGAEHMQAFSVPFMRVQQVRPPIAYIGIKRAFDILASTLAIILLSPFMLVTAIAIKAQDGGPVLYKQVRLTKDRKEFKVLKFRSMRVDAEKDGVARLATENDDRITPVGKLIRKIRFDELPQLFNILKGDMSVVGPRPERPEIASQYEEEIPSFGLRLQVKAGLTGYAQVYGRYNTEPYDKLKMDLMYINRMSVVEDLRIILATVKVLFMGESTEGIEEGQITAAHKSGEQTKEKQSV